MNTKQLFKGCVLGLAGMATLALALIVDVTPVANIPVPVTPAILIKFLRFVFILFDFIKNLTIFLIPLNDLSLLS